MILHGIQNTVVDIVILHAGSKLNLLIATEEGITTSLGGGEGRGRTKKLRVHCFYLKKWMLAAEKALDREEGLSMCRKNNCGVFIT